MEFVADESVDGRVVAALRRAGHQVLYIAEDHPGAGDAEVLRLCHSARIPLITEDKDFGELVFRQRQVSHGVLLLRMHGVPEERKCPVVLGAIEAHGCNLPGLFCVIEPDRIRIRGVPP